MQETSIAFHTPGLLWFLLGGPVYFFLLLQARRLSPLSVPSLLPWRDVPEGQLSEILSRPDLRLWLPALLATLALCGTITAAAGPYLSHASPRPVQIFLDRSASMQAVNAAGTSRYEQVLEELENLGESGPVEREWNIVFMPRKQNENLSGPFEEIRTPLIQTSPADVALSDNRLKEIVRTSRREPYEQILVTDRVLSFAPEEEQNLHRIRSDIHPENTGIISLHGARDENQLHLFPALFHSGVERREVSLTARPAEGNEEKVLDTVRVSLEPNKMTNAELSLSLPTEAPVEPLQISIKPAGNDGLRVDDTVYTAPANMYDLVPGLSGEPPELLEALLASLDGVSALDGQGADPDFLVLYRPDSLPSGPRPPDRPVVVIRPAPGASPVPYRDRNMNFSPGSFHIHAHEITSDVHARALRVRGRPFDHPEDPAMVPLISGSEDPLVMLRDTQPPAIFFSFDPFEQEPGERESNFLFDVVPRTSAVILFQNIIHYLSPWNLDRSGDLVHWKTTRIPFRSDRNVNWNPEEHPPERAGISWIETPQVSGPYPRNLLSRAETDLYRENLPASERLDIEGGERSTSSLSGFVLLISFFLLCGSLWCFQ